MPAHGRKQSGSDIAPVMEGEIVPASLEELDKPAGLEGEDELDDAVEMAEDDEEDEDEDEDDEDEDEDEDEEDADADADADDEDEEDEDDDEEGDEDKAGDDTAER